MPPRFYVQQDFYELDHFSEVKAMREITYGALQKEGQIVRSPTCSSSSWPYDHGGLLRRVRDAQREVQVDDVEIDVEAPGGAKPR
ncbi:hypothetical protein RLEG12_25835 [Rhizobium leguminosarum bv. trifolii CB782]|nr:hypothetical protein RLEG12_25835 [Rhizobium leguminosarum bv. trifolii CB782]